MAPTSATKHGTSGAAPPNSACNAAAVPVLSNPERDAGRTSATAKSTATAIAAIPAISKFSRTDDALRRTRAIARNVRPMGRDLRLRPCRRAGTA